MIFDISRPGRERRARSERCRAPEARGIAFEGTIRAHLLRRMQSFVIFAETFHKFALHSLLPMLAHGLRTLADADTPSFAALRNGHRCTYYASETSICCICDERRPKRPPLIDCHDAYIDEHGACALLFLPSTRYRNTVILTAGFCTIRDIGI